MEEPGALSVHDALNTMFKSYWNIHDKMLRVIYMLQ